MQTNFRRVAGGGITEGQNLIFDIRLRCRQTESPADHRAGTRREPGRRHRRGQRGQRTRGKAATTSIPIESVDRSGGCAIEQPGGTSPASFSRGGQPGRFLRGGPGAEAMAKPYDGRAGTGEPDGEGRRTHRSSPTRPRYQRVRQVSRYARNRCSTRRNVFRAQQPPDHDLHRNKLPAMYEWPDQVEDGDHMAYVPTSLRYIVPAVERSSARELRRGLQNVVVDVERGTHAPRSSDPSHSQRRRSALRSRQSSCCMPCDMRGAVNASHARAQRDCIRPIPFSDVALGHHLVAQRNGRHVAVVGVGALVP